MATRRGGSYSYNALCDVCGFKFKNWQLKKRWDGYMVCSADWEPRHPMDFYRSRNDVHQLPFTRSDNNGIDVGPTYTYPAGTAVCTVTTSQPLVGIGTVGCATLTS